MLFLNVPQTVLLLCGWVSQVDSARYDERHVVALQI